MSGRPYSVLILDWDEDTLITLQHVLEDAGVDTTVTWDEVEARKLIKNKPFDLLLVGDHPPELTAETILRDFNLTSISCPCMLLRANSSDSERFRRLGFSGAVSKRDPFRVVTEVQSRWQSQRSDTDVTTSRAGDRPPAVSGLLNSAGRAA